MIPLKDNIPTARFPLITVLLIALNVLVFAWQLTYPTQPALDEIGFSELDQSALEYGAIPYRITHPTQGRACAVGAVDAAGTAGVVCEGTPEYRRAQERAAGDPKEFVPLEDPPA